MAIVEAPMEGRHSWLGEILPGPGGTRGPRDPLTPEVAAELARRVDEALSGQGIELDVFVRRGGSLKIVPARLPEDGKALALQLARIANSLRAAGLSAWWTDSGITAGPGPSSPVPSADQARQFLASRLGNDTVITRDMIEIAQAVMPGSADSPARAVPGRNPPAPHSPGGWSSYEVTTPVGDDLRWEPVRQKRRLTSELPDFPESSPFDAASRPAQARGRARRSSIAPGPGAAPRP